MVIIIEELARWFLGLFAPLLWTGTTAIGPQWLYKWRDGYILVRRNEYSEYRFEKIAKSVGKDYVRMFFKSLVAQQSWEATLTEKGRVEFNEIIR